MPLEAELEHGEVEEDRALVAGLGPGDQRGVARGAERGSRAAPGRSGSRGRRRARACRARPRPGRSPTRPCGRRARRTGRRRARRRAGASGHRTRRTTATLPVLPYLRHASAHPPPPAATDAKRARRDDHEPRDQRDAPVSGLAGGIERAEVQHDADREIRPRQAFLLFAATRGSPVDEAAPAHSRGRRGGSARRGVLHVQPRAPVDVVLRVDVARACASRSRSHSGSRDAPGVSISSRLPAGSRT